ncbi:hypothetical protein [Sediminitomix flava]|uniref:Ig-like domain-containing protein n=1 Tax=Sediminitomix flava TaxID=379075 RepID=A0A315ZAH2_SEDFL|nr:hypothetical protein [Sediminitomix flava]PWJ42282.1 hypothetical protein BC781_103534 [Sediminitomix flava]
MKSAILTTILFLIHGALFAQTAFEGTRIRVGEGRYTRSEDIKIYVKTPKNLIPKKIRASNYEDMRDSHWVGYTNEFVWTITKGDGLKTVYVQIADIDKNVSPIYSGSVTLDTTKPETPTVEFDTDSKYINGKQSLEIGVIISCPGGKYFMLSNTPSFHGVKWRAIKDDYLDWQLEDGNDGVRKIYVKSRDAAGNVSQISSDEIYVDRKAPFDCHVQINNGELYTLQQNKFVDLQLSARQADYVMVSTDENFSDAEWLPYRTSMDFQLKGEDGEKTVFVKFKDEAGNESTICSDNIIVDTKAPQYINVLIDGGANQTTHINKMVTLEINTETDVEYIMISNTPSFQQAHWRRLHDRHEWQLSGEEDGMRYIYVKVKDKAGNISSPIRASIKLVRGMGIR